MKLNVLKPFLFVALLVMVVGLACSVDLTGTKEPSEPPQPIIQPTAQSQPIQLPTQQPLQPPPQQPNQPTPISPTVPVAPSGQFFKENFNGNVDSWKPFVTKGKMSQLNLSIQNGFYVFDLPQTQVWGYSVYTPQVYTDVRLDVVAENRGFNNNNVSLLCRYSETEGWYEASIANNGLWWIYYGKWDSSHVTASYALIYSGGSNDIHQGKASNTYTLICDKRTITLLINGVQAHKGDDNKHVLREGNIGVGVSSFDTIPIRVDFDSVEITQP